MISITKAIKWMRIADNMAKELSTCAKRQYCAIILDENGAVIGTGYNGAPRDIPHCDDGYCPRFQEGSESGSSYDNCVAVHAEHNAIIHSNYTDRRAGETTLIINGMPCFTCAKTMANASINNLIYIPDESYIDMKQTTAFLARTGMKLIPLTLGDIFE